MAQQLEHDHRADAENDVKAKAEAVAESWIQCDSCSKWRRVAQLVADNLPEDAPWYCEMNKDSIYNDCSVPQELTDNEIDDHAAALQDTPAQEEEQQPKETKRFGKLRKRPPVWQVVTKNNYLHRQRKVQDEDDIMICQCKPIWATDTTTIGCGEHCLNRMLNIECVPEFCPCGNRCTNRMFSTRKYAPLDVKRAGAKGFGLFATKDLTAGEFIIEYVGEVLDEDEYSRRREFYAGTGQRHYYFMNVGNGEVIDATRRGGMGRFINHSCEPNCETQKWVVRGELAIGLFALEDIPAGTELTFDYNFERYGDKPMKCLCESKSCRGIIGGTQETASAVAAAKAAAGEPIEVPEEDEEAEPIMVAEKEQDPALTAILDRAVGLGWESGWDTKMQKRLEKLAARQGVELPPANRNKASAAGTDGAAGSDEDDDEEDEDYTAAAAAAAAAGLSARKGSAAKRPRAPKARVRRQDPDWEQPSSSADGRQGGPASLGKASSAVFGDESASVVSARDAAFSELGGGASTIPRRAPSIGVGGRILHRRRSEVDRRLEGLVGPSGRLRDANTATIVRVLRMFNLCDISPAVSRNGEQAERPVQSVKPPSTAAVDEPSHEDQANGSQAPPPPPPLEAAVEGHQDTQQGGEQPPPPPPPPPGSPQGEHPSSRNESGGEKEDGEVSPERVPTIPKQQAVTAAGTSMKDNRTDRQSTDDGEGGYNSRARAPSPPGAELTPRQQARIADLSLLLDVVLKTSGLSARKEFVRCGVLRQLLGVVGGHTGARYAVALRKVLRVVETLPFTADDMHHTRSAHGSFAELLRDLTQHPDYEIRNKAWGMLKKWPVSACLRPVPMESRHSMAQQQPYEPGSGSARFRPGGGPPPPYHHRGSDWRPPRDGSSDYMSPRAPLPFHSPSPLHSSTSRDGGLPPYSGGSRDREFSRDTPRDAGYGRDRERDYPYREGGGREGPPYGREPLPPSRFGRSNGGGPGGGSYYSDHRGGPPPPLPLTRGGSGYPSTPLTDNRGGPTGGWPPVSNGARPEQHPYHNNAHQHHHSGSTPMDHQPPSSSTYRGVGGEGEFGRVSGRKRSRWDEEEVRPGSASGSHPPSSSYWDTNTEHYAMAPPPLPSTLSTLPLSATTPSGSLPPLRPGALGGGSGAATAVGHTTIAAGPMLSPMTDDEDNDGDGDGSGGRGRGSADDDKDIEDNGDTWDSPDEGFEVAVAEIVRRRVGKYEQADHPLCVTRNEAAQVFRKVRKEVIAKEQSAFEERRSLGQFKPIERKKLETRIREFVRESVKRMHAQR